MHPCSLRATSRPRHARRAARVQRSIACAAARGSGRSVALRCARVPRIRAGDGQRAPPAGAPSSGWMRGARDGRGRACALRAPDGIRDGRTRRGGAPRSGAPLEALLPPRAATHEAEGLVVSGRRRRRSPVLTREVRPSRRVHRLQLVVLVRVDLPLRERRASLRGHALQGLLCFRVADR